MTLRMFTLAFTLGILSSQISAASAASVELCRTKKCPGTTKTCLQCKGSGPKGAPDCCAKIEQPPPQQPPVALR